ncbi:hypothetical protein LSUE1_G007592 [Lachnellula suecica]|uniref:Uncharacterized protein n=1 Tax=Lachnellula suecica TaxID=602035 RepID=A0A8T9C4X9_9HELO|nr:hypothetical protein LSUE1_G007592 [Lachnellula suecica]
MAAATTVGSETRVSDEIMRLREEVRWLGETERTFRELFESRKWCVRWFLECSGGMKDMRREKSESEDVVYSNKMHGEMVKFKGSEDGDWKNVKKALCAAAEV